MDSQTPRVQLPVTIQSILPPLLIKSEQSLDTFRGKCPIIVSSFITVMAYLSSGLLGSLLQSNTSLIAAIHIAL